MENKTNLNVSLNISPDLKQSLKILEMNGIELMEYVRQECIDNPLLEMICSPEHIQWEDRLPDIRDDIEGQEWDASQPYHSDEVGSFCANFPTIESMTEHLIRQLFMLPLNRFEYRIARYIICSLDEVGYYREEHRRIAALFRTDVKTVENVLKLVQTLEPCGIGARNLRECLLIQISQNHPKDTLLRTLIENYWTELRQNKLKAIADHTGKPLSDVVRCKKALGELNPKPGAGFSQEPYTNYIIPDLIATKRVHRYEIEINGSFYPKIQFNSEYARMLQTEKDPRLQKYLTEHMQRAVNLKANIEKRNATLLKIAYCILSLQQSFPEKGILVPMRMEDVAKEVNLHVSTVSRAVKDKYIQYPQGVFSLKSFFSRELSTKETGDSPKNMSTDSSVSAKREICNMIESEDKTNPFSDAEMASELLKKGFYLAKRTVTKYRNELNIPNSFQRKQFF